ncbi:MAG: topoisomerase DNA-binding C4 zinc finger domain-containing protein [Halobacteriales archaeon]
MPEETIHVLAGDCTLQFENEDDTRREERGAVLAVVKPDDTVLVHDRGGYRPAAWLTRAESVTTRTENGEPVIEAVEGDRRLVVTCHEKHGLSRFPVSGVGSPAGTCPDCDGPLVRTPTAVECPGGDRRHGLPRDAELLESTCDDCGLPTMRIERGAAFELCVDRHCESLDDRVRDRFDGAWDCPACGAPLRVLRRGGLLVGCEAYPDCETAFRLPAGVVDGDCAACGLPAFETTTGRRCLDASCPGPALAGTAD